ncbi:S8 family serine peptidase [Arthrobacter sp. H20]|uniref:S8 family serine peptidase n=1 Tax=Arthrobacter sp. H20 TaxID=1267981 RepID=UPI00047AB3C2|nr:S8 family serine peptidase [Arthrobacter sp. H20]
MIESDSSGSRSNRREPETTGRYIVVFADSEPDAPALLRSMAGVSNIADSRDFGTRAVDPLETRDADATVFYTLGVAVVSADPQQARSLRTSSDEGAIISVSPELIHHILTNGPDDPGENGPSSFQDTAQSTWGLQAVAAAASPWTGNGIRVAILDTGFDSGHPDFEGRLVTVESFIPDELPQDGHGHGTHCIGTSCGPRTPSEGAGYGVACEAEIFSGKVLSDSGSGSDGGIIAGIDWAVTNGCAVISMSLGADIAEVHPPYTAVGQRALDAGSLIIAAAGNNADRRQNDFGFVGAPANSPFILAVGALDQQLDMAYFSARTLPIRGGQLDVAGPGFKVYSSWPMPDRYNTISGTSMATPHAAGIAALWAQATGYRGRELWSVMVQESHRLINPSVDVGSGLVMAPQE